MIFRLDISTVFLSNVSYKLRMDNNNQTKWERFPDPEVLRPNLILASVYIAAFEILKNSIIERLGLSIMVGVQN